MCRCFPGSPRAPFNFFAAATASTSLTSVLFPEPETPVTHVNSPTGNCASTPFKLCSRASRTVSQAPSGFFNFAAFVTAIVPAKNGPVRESVGGNAAHCTGVP